MESSIGSLLTKKNIFILLIVGTILLVVPFGLSLLKDRQVFKSNASGEVTFSGPSVRCDTAGNCTTTSENIQIELRSPFGPPGATGSGTPR